MQRQHVHTISDCSAAALLLLLVHAVLNAASICSATALLKHVAQLGSLNGKLVQRKLHTSDTPQLVVRAWYMPGKQATEIESESTHAQIAKKC
jgi:hypothetical protein